MKAMEGSFTVTKNGVVRYPLNSFKNCRLPCLISDSDLSFSLPVDFLRRWARFKRIKSALVSGKQKKSRSQLKLHRISSSYIDHLQVLSGTENPAKSGPSAGPASAAPPQKIRPYGIFGNDKISAAEAPPVARTGPPRKP